MERGAFVVLLIPVQIIVVVQAVASVWLIILARTRLATSI
jgi:hypothetical protein